MKRLVKPILALLCILCMILPMSAPVADTFTVMAAELTVPEKPYKIANTVSGVHVYWYEVDGIEKYGVWRSETGKDGTYKWLGNPTTNHFTDTKVVSGKTYFYKITTMDTTTNTHSDKSEALGITYVATPDISKRANTDEGIYLAWKAVTGAKGYAIYRKSYSGTDAWVRIATIEDNTTLEYTDDEVVSKNGTAYRYTIRALAGSNLATLSGCRNTGRTMVRLTSRTLSSVTAGTDSIKCSWNTTAQATGYEILFVDEDGNEITHTVENYKTGTKTFTGFEPDTTYSVQVRSYKTLEDVGSFYSAWSDAESVTTEAEAAVEVPAKPYKITNVVSGVHVYWKAVEGAVKYGVWRSETGKDGTYKWLGNPAKTDFTDTTAVSGTTYYYKISAINPETGEHSDKSEAIGIIYVATPDITSRINEWDGIALAWNQIDGAEGYAVYRKTYGGTDAWTRVATLDGEDSTAWWDYSTMDGEVYQYTVRALAGSDLKTLSGCRNAGRTMARLDVMEFADVAALSSTTLKLSWEANSKVTGYEICITDGNENDEIITISDNTVVSYIVSDLQPETDYEVEIRSYLKVDGVGSFYSAWWDTYTIETGTEEELTGTFEYEELDDGTLMLTFYEGNELNVVIPEKIDGMTVTAIGDYCFSYCDSILTVEIPDTITYIGEGAFEGCWNLTEIEIPDSVTFVGEYGFDYCENLTKLHIPASVEEFYIYAYENSDGEIYSCQETMYGLTNLTEVTVDAKNTVYTAVDGILYSKDKTQLIYVPDAYEGVVTIEDTVTCMEVYGSFQNCHSITEIVIPKNMRLFDNSVGYCHNLKKYTVAAGNQYYTTVNGVLFDIDKTTLVSVPGASLDKTYAVPEGIVSVDYLAFDSCHEVEEISIPASVEYLGYARGESGVTWGDGIVYDGLYESIFNNCYSLTTITVAADNAYYKSVGGVLFSKDGTVLVTYPMNKAGETYSIPAGVTAVGEYAFFCNYNLLSVTIPSSVEVLQPDAFFASCVEEVKFSEGLKIIGAYAFSNSDILSVDLPDSVEHIGRGAFQNCREMEAISLSENLTYIGEYAFRNCNELTAIRIPEGVTEIPNWAFYSCKALINVELPSTVTSIGDHAFAYCPFTELELPSDLNSLGYSAFFRCTGLTSISIPEGVTEIPNGLFGGCTALEELKLPASVETIRLTAFSGCKSLTTIYAPAGSVAAEFAEKKGYELVTY